MPHQHRAPSPCLPPTTIVQGAPPAAGPPAAGRPPHMQPGARCAAGSPRTPVAVVCVQVGAIQQKKPQGQASQGSNPTNTGLLAMLLGCFYGLLPHRNLHKGSFLQKALQSVLSRMPSKACVSLCQQPLGPGSSNLSKPRRAQTALPPDSVRSEHKSRQLAHEHRPERNMQPAAWAAPQPTPPNSYPRRNKHMHCVGTCWQERGSRAG